MVCLRSRGGFALARRLRISVGLHALPGVLAAIVFLPCLQARGQEMLAESGADEARVMLNFPQEIEIKALVDYVSERLGVRILYDEETAGKLINVRAPGDIPASSLLGVLESALKMKGLALVDADAPGWKRIVNTTQLANVAPSGDAAEAIERYGAGTAVTQAFVLRHADPEQVDQIIEPFLTQPGANSIVLAESGTLIVTDYATNLLKIARWIEFIDRPPPDVAVEFVPVEYVAAADLTSQITAILLAKARAEGRRQIEAQVELIHDVRTNQILLIGQQAQVDQAKQLIRSLDVPLNLVTRTYTFETVKAASIDRLAQQLVAPDAGEHLYRSIVDEEENLLIVTSTEEIHQGIEQLRAARDVPVETAPSPIRLYRVKNLPVAELLQTIRSIEQASQDTLSPRSDWQRLPTDGRIRPARERALPGPNRLPLGPGSELPQPPAVREPDAGEKQSEESTSFLEGEDSRAAQLLRRARVTADIHTNTLIVVAEPSVQRLYSELIEELDRRRAQVLIEAKFVIIDTSDDFSLGVEYSGGDRSGSHRLFAFTSYGLSNVDPVSGALSIIPGLGFNGTLVNPDVADEVLKALTNHSRARVVSAPRILVNDNATGQLTSVAEVPFTSVNASQTVATTSFAGFADAGTTITVSPRISDEDHLQLDFAITVNTFTGTGSEGVPPPRETEEITSQITIPDGHTVIVGGLSRRNQSYDYTGFPLIDMIPILREATGLTTTADSSSSMFIFLRPIILREDKFRDLKFLSERDVSRACVRPRFPASKPIWIQ